MRRHINTRHRNKRYKLIKTALSAICIVFIFVNLERQIKPMVLSMAETKAKIAVTQTLNDSIVKTFNSNTIF